MATPDGESPFFFGYRVTFGNHGHRPSTLEDETLSICTSAASLPSLTERLRMPFKLLGTVVEYTIESDDTAIVLRFGSVAEFLLTSTCITCRIPPGVSPDLAKWLLYGAVAGVWLEMRGHCVLHGAVVAQADGAVAFLGSSGSGKSTMVGALSRLGCRILADDHVVIDTHGGRLLTRPGLPWIKVSPATARFLGVEPDRLPLLHAAVRKRAWFLPRVDTQVLPLRRIVVLDRRHEGGPAPIEQRPLSTREAFSALVTHAYSPLAVRALGYQPRRLPVLAQLSSAPGVTRISYQSGFSHLDQVAVDVRRLVE